jgi:hypothetical protein
MSTRFTLVFAFAAGLIAAGDLRAQTTCADRTATVDTADQAASKLVVLDTTGCLGGVNCKDGICADANKVLAELAKATASGQSTASLSAPASALLTTILEEGRKLSNDATVSPAMRDAAKTVLSRMALALADFTENQETAAAAWPVDDLTLFKDQPYAVPLRKLLEGCNTQQACTARFVEVRRLVDLTNLFQRVLIAAKQPDRNAFAAHLARLDRQWQAYLGSSRGQYPWELLINSIRYRKTAAFDAPPTSQLVILHPGAGYELGKNANNKNPSEALFLEMFGYYAWKWTKDDRMQQRLGGSVALSWRDAGPDRRRMGYAALIYLPRASTVGYVWRPQDGKDEHALMLSADLVKFIRGTAGIRDKLLGGR